MPAAVGSTRSTGKATGSPRSAPRSPTDGGERTGRRAAAGGPLWGWLQRRLGGPVPAAGERQGGSVGADRHGPPGSAACRGRWHGVCSSSSDGADRPRRSGRERTGKTWLGPLEVEQPTRPGAGDERISEIIPAETDVRRERIARLHEVHERPLRIEHGDTTGPDGCDRDVPCAVDGEGIEHRTVATHGVEPAVPWPVVTQLQLPGSDDVPREQPAAVRLRYVQGAHVGGQADPVGAPEDSNAWVGPDYTGASGAISGTGPICPVSFQRPLPPAGVRTGERDLPGHCPVHGLPGRG